MRADADLESAGGVVAAALPAWPAPADVVALVKPRIMTMALLTAAGGMSLAPVTATPAVWLALMIGTGLIVGAANTLNMYLERDIDCLMARTRNRPLPARRMDPSFALGFGVAQAVVSVPLLTFALDPLTGLLGVVALLSYVMLYTPLKQRSTVSTWIGAVPGAMPALMGWTAATGRLDLGGLSVFALLFIWQIPHFHAIALFRQREYDRAGLKTVPGTRGSLATRREIALYSVVQLAVSVTPWALGIAGWPYAIVALAAGAAYTALALRGLAGFTTPSIEARWARRLFLASIVYLPAVFVTMVLNGQL
jgi:protoheme IX farnesyltransferase